MLLEDSRQALEGIESVADARAALESFAARTGHAHYTFISGRVGGGVRVADFDPRRRPFSLTNVPQDWYREYVKGRYDDSDPILQYAIRKTLPARWSAVTGRRALPPAYSKIVARAREHGLADGLVVPVHAPGGEFGVLSLSGATRGDPEADMPQEAHWFAINLHTRLQEVLRPGDGDPAADLSPREIDVLYWTAEGKSSWEISQILSISQATVNFHINSAKRKLGVFSKTHAVAKMYTLGSRARF